MVGAVVWLSLTPSPPKLEFEASDKLGHLLGYGTLMFWFSQLYVERKTRISYAAGFAAMGVALEFVQGQLGYRTYEVFDMYANALGVLAGWAAALILPRVLPGAERETR
jgi:VanZ family protein